MSKAKLDALEVRLDVLALTLTALARAVPPERAAAVQATLRRAVAQRLDGVVMHPSTDAALAADLGGLFRALDAGSA